MSFQTQLAGARFCAPLVTVLIAFGVAACGARSQLFSDETTTTRDASPPLCANETTDLRPSYVEIVLDGSGSMKEDHKWEAAVIALDTVFDRALDEGDPLFALGISVFSDKVANEIQKCVAHHEACARDEFVPPAFVDERQHSRLRGRIHGTEPVANTPTGEALSAAYDILDDYVPEAPTPGDGRRFVMLISDGVPTSGYATAISYAAAAAAGSPAIRTFALGIGAFPASTAYNPEFMGRLAVAGETRATETCNPLATSAENICHLQIDPAVGPTRLTKDFIAAFNRVRAITRACE